MNFLTIGSMKKIIFGCILCVLTSCIHLEAEKYDIEFGIENNTTVPVELQFYRTGELAFRYGITPLEVGEQLIGVGIERRGEPWSDLDEENLSIPGDSFEADSIRIIFNNEKIRICTFLNSFEGPIFTPIDKNIFNSLEYTSIGNDQFLFKLEESDYESAEDCLGDCN